MTDDPQGAQAVRLDPIGSVAERLGIQPEDLVPYGDEIAKVRIEALARPRQREGAGRLVLVSAINPTRAGEGKTTVSIGLAQGMDLSTMVDVIRASSGNTWTRSAASRSAVSGMPIPRSRRPCATRPRP